MKKESKGKAIKFQPADDRLLVKPMGADEKKTASGIYIPDTASKEKPERGTVVAIGPGRRNDKGDVIAIRYKVGDKVMFSKYGFDEVKLDEEEYYIIAESSILGTFK